MERLSKKTLNIFEGLINVDENNALANLPGFTSASNLGTQRNLNRHGNFSNGAGGTGGYRTSQGRSFSPGDSRGFRIPKRSAPSSTVTSATVDSQTAPSASPMSFKASGTSTGLTGLMDSMNFPASTAFAASAASKATTSTPNSKPKRKVC